MYNHLSNVITVQLARCHLAPRTDPPMGYPPSRGILQLPNGVQTHLTTPAGSSPNAQQINLPSGLSFTYEQREDH